MGDSIVIVQPATSPPRALTQSLGPSEEVWAVRDTAASPSGFHLVAEIRAPRPEYQLGDARYVGWVCSCGLGNVNCLHVSLVHELRMAQYRGSRTGRKEASTSAPPEEGVR